MPLHVAKVRSNNRVLEGAADERARKHGGRGTSQNQAPRSRSGSWRIELCCELLAQEAETSLILM